MVRKVALAFFIIAALALGVRVFACPAVIGSPASIPTLNKGDLVLFSRLGPMTNAQPKRYQLVFVVPPFVNNEPYNPVQSFTSIATDLTGIPFEPPPVMEVRRVIALPGETVVIRQGLGTFIDGKLLDETLYTQSSIGCDLFVLADMMRLGERDGEFMPYENGEAPITVPKDMLFVMADNRKDCPGSETWGFISQTRVVGQLTYRVSSKSIDPIPVPRVVYATEKVAINDDGVRALEQGQFTKAIHLFKSALALDNNFELARDNLSIAYNNFAIENASKPDVALDSLHKALFLDPDNEMTRKNLAGIIKRMGMNPGSYNDRLTLAENSEKQGKKVSALIEYREALKLKLNPSLLAKVSSLEAKCNFPAHAIPEDQFGGEQAPRSDESATKLAMASPAKTPDAKDRTKPVTTKSTPDTSPSAKPKTAPATLKESGKEKAGKDSESKTANLSMPIPNSTATSSSGKSESKAREKDKHASAKNDGKTAESAKETAKLDAETKSTKTKNSKPPVHDEIAQGANLKEQKSNSSKAEDIALKKDSKSGSKDADAKGVKKENKSNSQKTDAALALKKPAQSKKESTVGVSTSAAKPGTTEKKLVSTKETVTSDTNRIGAGAVPETRTESIPSAFAGLESLRNPHKLQAASSSKTKSAEAKGSKSVSLKSNKIAAKPSEKIEKIEKTDSSVNPTQAQSNAKSSAASDARTDAPNATAASTAASTASIEKTLQAQPLKKRDNGFDFGNMVKNMFAAISSHGTTGDTAHEDRDAYRGPPLLKDNQHRHQNDSKDGELPRSAFPSQP